jgi:hypothetical protein
MSLMLPPEPTTEVKELPSDVAMAAPIREDVRGSTTDQRPPGGPMAKLKALTSRLPFDKIPEPLRNLARPILFGSLGLHALLLFAPLPGGEVAKKPEKKEAPVKITQIPTGKFDKAKTTTPKILPKIAPPALPKVAVQSSRPQLTVPTSATPAPASTTSPTPNPSEVPVQKTPTQVTPASPSERTTPEKTTTDPFAEFPKFQPSTPNCFGKGGPNCLIAQNDLLSVSSWYLTNAKAQKFELTKTNDSDAGKSIFEATKDGKTYYLSLLSDGGSTVILLAPEKLLDLSKLKDGPVISVPSEYTELLGALLPIDTDKGGNQAHPNQFPEPSAFFSDLTNETARSEVADTPKFGPGDPASFFATLDASGLKGIFQEVSPVGVYGGGNLYKLKKDSTIIFMSLVPKKGGDGTIVVTWTKDPR